MNASTTALLVLFVVSLVPLLPTEVTLIGMGVAAAQGGASLPVVIAVASVGCLISDQGLYAIGRFGGPHLLDRLRRRRGIDAGITWLDGKLQQHPRPVLVVARWLPSGGTVGALLAGSLRWPLGEFLTASVVGVTLWTSYVSLLGYLGGQMITEPAISMLLSLGVALVLGSVITVKLKRERVTAP
ncbi:DedA family protein [Amycolatopsis sp. H20-H5]|uniref:DedA family protein n=1 Tax=Amycolatopsis sp. H20-H5 TaxID=3046309 RepID=UPI002DBE8E2E|nr:DedA family protein [Amycolatopsis sp. H20-H5]MEC3975119.1 DedA family protein [Amycolatopsis sp. H20-H5]